MTTPEDLTPKESSPPPAPKKPAAKKTTPAASTATGAKPKTTTVSKPAAKKATQAVAANPATSPAPAKAPAKAATPAKAKPAKSTPPKPDQARASAKPAATKTATTKTAAPKSAPSKPKTTAAIAKPTVDNTEPAVEPQLPASPAAVSAPGIDWASTQAAKILNRVTNRPVKSGFVATLQQKATLYWRLTRMDRPIGTLLLLWPTLWSLWIAAKGVPSTKNLVIFVLGVIVMRAAGCVINDFADRKIDGKVMRTKDRPLATGAVSSREAIGLFIGLCLIAFALVLFTDPLTIKLSVGGLVLAFCYPFMKRHTHLPQVVLGAAFAWGIPMAYAAEAGELHQGMWLIYLAVVLWTVAYDTFYAMVDRDDDLKIGVKSTAILFGEQDRVITGALQIMTLCALMLVGNRFELGGFYSLGLAVAAGLFIYQQWLIRFRARAACFKAFLNNNWVGVAVFAGIVMDYSFR